MTLNCTQNYQILTKLKKINRPTMNNIWNITKAEAGWKVKNEDRRLLNIDGSTTNNCQVISDAFNNYLLSVAESMYRIFR
jgi:hypothetical protein